MLGQSKGIHSTSTLSPYHASLALLHAVEQSGGGSGNSSAINSPLVASPSVRSSPSQQLRSFRLSSSQTTPNHSAHTSTSTACVVQSGGMVILRGTRCCCESDGSIRYLLTNETIQQQNAIGTNNQQSITANLNITLPSSPSFPPHSSDPIVVPSQSSLCHPPTSHVSNVSRHSHSSLCIPALIKTTSNLQPHHELTAILRFELMAFQRLYDRNVKRKRAEEDSMNVVTSRALSEPIIPAWTHNQSNSANASGNNSTSNSNSNSFSNSQLPTLQRYPALPPELVTLTDSRLALVLAQEYQNCINLKEFIAIQFAPSRHQRSSNSLHTSNSSHSLSDNSSSAPKSENSSSTGTTANTSATQNSSVGPVPHFSYQHIQCVLQIGLQLCEALSQLHLSGLVHKHVMPSSLLVYPDTKQISFLDLSHSSLLYRDQIDSQSTVTEHAMDYLPYISPEQTGKANRSTDNRSDLYSVGTILYECISGFPPFAGNHKRTLDSMEIIHMHVAATPATLYPTSRVNLLPPCLGNPLILLNSIVMKLLSKSADERYQSAGGLAADLKYCLNLLESVHAPTTSALSSNCSIHSTNHPAYFSFQPDIATASNVAESHPVPHTPLGQPIGEFRIGQLDDYSTFRLSQKLYGREKQIAQLVAAYDRIRADPSELGSGSGGRLTISPQLVLIDALSGIGKTALCDEMHKIVLKKRGLFARGRFDVYKRDSSCILAAFRDLMIQLLVQNTLTWKVKILRAVGSNAQVLIDSIPELERIIGAQPQVPPLPLVEAQARFQAVFQQFLSVFATSETPLVLALESVQWADAASVKLIKLMHSLFGGHLLLIVCYRPNEVDENSPLTKLINELIYRPEYSSYDLDQQGGTTNTIAPSANRVEQIHLSPIDLEDTIQFVCDSFRCVREKAFPLATLLLSKSLGSPFFIAALLKSFHDTGLLSFDFHAREWKWDLAAMKLTAVSEDVVDIVCVQLKKLNEHSQTILKLAACTGNRFTMGLLATISQIPVGELAHYLCELEQTGLIIATAHSSELFLLASEEERSKSQTSNVNQSILPTDSNVQTLSPTSAANIALDRICFRFAHDKICSAAYRLIPTNELASLHMKIAQLMLNNAKDPSEVSANAMNLSTHINASIRMQLEDEEQSAATLEACFHSGIDLTGVIRIELEAGRQAKAVGAHAEALPFFKIALLLLPHSVGLTPTTPVSASSLTSSQLEVASEECWKRNYDLCYEVHLAVSECLYSTFAYEAAIAFSKGAYVYAKSGLHRVQLIIQQVCCHVQKSELTVALDVGMTKMRTIGVKFLPSEPSDDLKTWMEDIKHGKVDWSTYPEMVRDDFNTASHALFLAISSVLFFTCSEHKASMTWTALNFVREKGVCPASAMAVVMAAPILFAQGDIEGAAAMTRASQALLQRFQQDRYFKMVNTKVATIALGHVGFLSDSATGIANKLMDVYDECKDSGDVEWLSYIQVFWTHWCLNSGLALPLVLERQSELMTEMINLKQDLCCHYLHLEMLFCKKLMGLAPVSDRHEYFMQGNKVTDLQLLERLEEQKNYLLLYRGYEVSTKFRFIIREIDNAVNRGELAYNLLKSQPQLGYCSQLFFYYSLALCASAPTLNISSLTDPMEHLGLFKSRSKIGKMSAPAGRIVDTKFFVYNCYPHQSYDAGKVQAILTKVDEMLQILQCLAAANPNLFYHKMLLVEAERQRVLTMSHMGSNSQFASATALYMESMSVAKLNGYLQEEALAGELYARYLMAIGWCATVGPALVLLKDCYIAYEKWGATVKLQQLVDEFPFLSSCDIEQSTVLASAADGPSGARVPLPHDTRVWPSNGNANQNESRQASNDTLKPGSVLIVAGSGVSIPPSSPTPTPTLTSALTHRTRQSSDNKESNQNQSFTHGSAVTSAAPSNHNALHHRDLLPIVKAIQTISVEKNWKKLLKKLMSIVLQSAGATRGILVLNDPDASEWRVELAANVEAIESEDLSPERSKSTSVPATPAVADDGAPSNNEQTSSTTSAAASATESSSDSFKTMAGDAKIHLLLNEVPLLEDAVPMSIFHFCRTSKETIVICEPNKLIDSAFSAFAEDVYFSKHHPKAVLCCPVLKGGDVVGVLYLENDGHAAAFTSAHIQLLQLLCSQAALSIDNARLWFRLQVSHSSLEATVKERTLELEERNAQLLRAKEEAEKATLSKSAFLSNMSHEIRTPLNAVLGISRLLADTPLTLEQDQYLSMISNSGHLLLTIINDVLDYSKIEANQLKLELVPYSLIDAVETAVMLCHDAASTKRLDLHYYIQPDAPHIFLIDAMRLQQILLNLLSNGIKFCNAGEVGLTVECQQIRGREYELIFHVRDQGIGIHPSDIAKLFQSFSQVGTSQAKASGTGLGLVISKRLAEAMQGRIWCSSEVGKGSVFSFSIHAKVPDDTPVPRSLPNQADVPLWPAPSKEKGPPSDSNAPFTPVLPALVSPHQLAPPGSTFATNLNPYQLSAADCELLRNSRIVLLGHRDGSLKVWSQLLEIYSCVTHIEHSSASAFQYISEHYSNSMSSGKIDLLLLENYDSWSLGPGASENENIEDLIDPQLFNVLVNYTPLSLLFLTDRYYHASSTRTTPVSLTRTLTPTSSNGSLSQSSLSQALSDANLAKQMMTSDRLRPDALTKPMTAAEKLAYANEAAVAKLQTRSPALTSRRLVGKNDTVVSPIQGINSPVILPRPSSTRSTSSTTSATSATSSSFGYSRFITDELSMPFKHRDFLVCITKQLQRLKEAPASHVSSPVLISTGTSTPPSYEAKPELQNSLSIPSSTSQTSLLPESPHEVVNPPDVVHASSLTASIPTSVLAPTTVRSRTSKTQREPIQNIARQHPLKILLCEDNLINQRMMVMMLRKLGYEIQVAANGKECLELLGREAAKGPSYEIECILMDASMDVMNGEECTRVIRMQQLPHRKRPYIIAQTANASEEFRRQCIDCGMDSFLAKPINLGELVATLLEAYSAKAAGKSASPPTSAVGSTSTASDSDAASVIAVSPIVPTLAPAVPPKADPINSN